MNSKHPQQHIPVRYKQRTTGRRYTVGTYRHYSLVAEHKKVTGWCVMSSESSLFVISQSVSVSLLRYHQTSNVPVTNHEELLQHKGK